MQFKLVSQYDQNVVSWNKNGKSKAYLFIPTDAIILFEIIAGYRKHVQKK